jgi:hypothetical protein
MESWWRSLVLLGYNHVVKKLFLIPALAYISLYLGYGFASILFPQTQLVFDQKSAVPETRRLVSYFDNGSLCTLARSEKGFFEGMCRITKDPVAQAVSLTLDPITGKVERALIGNYVLTNNDVYDIDILPTVLQEYSSLTVLVLRHKVRTRRLASVLISSLLFLCGAFLLKKLRGLARPDWYEVIIKPFQYARRPHLIGTFLLGVVVTPFLVGVDALPMYGMISAFNHGIDPYQFQVNTRALTHFQFPNFPYGPSLLLFWGMLDLLTAPFVNLSAPFLGKHIAYSLLFKLGNVALVSVTLLTLAAFVRRAFPHHRSVTSTVVLTISTPLIFYVAFLYVQLDTVPSYFLVAGILCFASPLISGVLLGIAVSMKYQLLIFVPFLLAAYARLLFQKREESPSSVTLIARMFQGLTFGGAFVVSIGLLYGAPILNDSPFSLLLQHFPQKERVWFTTLSYVPGLVVYITPLVLIGLFGWFFFLLPTKRTLSEVQSATLLSLGGIISLFSASLIQTPSTLLQTLPSLFLLYVILPTLWERVGVFFLSLGVLTPWIFSDIGDITRLFQWNDGYFTNLVLTLPPSILTHYSSVTFTISVASLVSLGIMYLRAAHTDSSL